MNPALIAEFRQAKRDLKKISPRELSRSHALARPGQPFDTLLLRQSPLYRRSRALYLGQKGRYEPELASSPRTLSSRILIENRIEYSPIERELLWSLSDPVQSRDPAHFLLIRSFSSSLYHEQNHRVLWKKILPKPPLTGPELSLYFDLAEALVVMLDQALGDELGPERARLFYLSGVLYDPGTTMRAWSPSRREYRNYLQATMYATFLLLEKLSPGEIFGVLVLLFPSLPQKVLERAILRSGNLDRRFVEVTNPTWQARHARSAARLLGKASGRSKSGMKLSRDPLDNRIPYLLAERVLDLYGV